MGFWGVTEGWDVDNSVWEMQNIGRMHAMQGGWCGGDVLHSIGCRA